MEASAMLRLLCADVFLRISVVVRSTRLSSCLRKKQLFHFEKCHWQTISTTSKQYKDEEVKGPHAKKVVSVSQTPKRIEIEIHTEKWICAHSSKTQCNQKIIKKLQEMMEHYERLGYKGRYLSYKEVIQALRGHPKQMSFLKEMAELNESLSKNGSRLSYQNAIQALHHHPKQISSLKEAEFLPGVGIQMARKIWEIAQTDELKELKKLEENEVATTLKSFNNVWGAGPYYARKWYLQGFRIISDLKEKASLTCRQQVGVRLYDDLLDRMSREEAGEIVRIVKEGAEILQDGIIAQACGSYRRGKPTCGDVDVLITHPDGKSHKGMFHKLLSQLKESGFLTDDLLVSKNGKIYWGVCKLPGENRKHRRLDIIVVPYEEYACALMHFTGSARFNVSMKNLCKRQNMCFNPFTLKGGVVREGTLKLNEGTIIPTPTEESIFQVLNIPFRPPDERDH